MHTRTRNNNDIETKSFSFVFAPNGWLTRKGFWNVSLSLPNLATQPDDAVAPPLFTIHNSLSLSFSENKPKKMRLLIRREISSPICISFYVYWKISTAYCLAKKTSQQNNVLTLPHRFSNGPPFHSFPSPFPQIIIQHSPWIRKTRFHIRSPLPVWSRI